MELTAMIAGLEMIEPDQVMDVYTDSRLVVDTLTKWAAGWERRGWKRKTGSHCQPRARSEGVSPGRAATGRPDQVDPGSLRLPVERVRRLARHGIPARGDLNWSAESVLAWAGYSTDSPLYVHLCGVIAEDPELLEVIDGIPHQPAPNVFFAAVQLILKRHPTDPLASFYPNLTDPPLPTRGVGAVFRRFVLEHRDEILEIGGVRYTQTNECRRCTALLPGIWRGGPERFHLIDVGSSAGLNLGIDYYGYRWGDVTWGEAPLVLQAESRGVAPVPRPLGVLSRTAFDLNPIDPADSDGAAWLEALVWPELGDRLERLRAAMGLINGVPVSRVAGDALDTCPASSPRCRQVNRQS
jgi:hypothetical protein